MSDKIGPIFYEPSSDMLWVELRPWPGDDVGDERNIGGEEPEPGLIVHYARDGEPWAWEVEYASRRPDLVSRALAAVRAAQGYSRAA